jgi:hypothetical protein
VGRCGLDAFGSHYRQVAAACEHDNKPSDISIGGRFLDQFSDYQLLKKDSALYS